MVDTLWFIDPFLEKLEERSCKIPDKLYFSGYRDLKKSHKKYVGAQVSLLSFYNMNLFLRMIFFRHFDCTKSEFKVLKFKESELKDRRTRENHASWVYKFNDRAFFPSRFEHTPFFAPFYIFSQSGFLGRLWYSMVLWYFCRTLARLPHISAEISHNCTCYGNVGGYFIKFINSVSFWQKCSGSYY